MKKVIGNNMGKKYVYYLTEKIGKNFSKDFKPELSPKQMLELGVFGGYYYDKSWSKEFPKDWFKKAKLNPLEFKDNKYNYFNETASLPWEYWKKKGWLNLKHDPLGWFQWYARYYYGRRIDDDLRQIKRWKMIVRHKAQIEKNCKRLDLNCRKKQRQVLLHWAYDGRKV